MRPHLRGGFSPRRPGKPPGRRVERCQGPNKSARGPCDPSAATMKIAGSAGRDGPTAPSGKRAQRPPDHVGDPIEDRWLLIIALFEPTEGTRYALVGAVLVLPCVSVIGISHPEPRRDVPWSIGRRDECLILPPGGYRSGHYPYRGARTRPETGRACSRPGAIGQLRLCRSGAHGHDSLCRRRTGDSSCGRACTPAARPYLPRSRQR